MEVTEYTQDSNRGEFVAINSSILHSGAETWKRYMLLALAPLNSTIFCRHWYNFNKTDL